MGKTVAKQAENDVVKSLYQSGEIDNVKEEQLVRKAFRVGLTMAWLLSEEEDSLIDDGGLRMEDIT